MEVLDINILSLDQSTNISGYAFFVDKELKKYDIIDTSKCGKSIDRIKMLVEWLQWFLSKNKVDLIVFEDVTFQDEAKYKQSTSYKESHKDEKPRDNIITFKTLSKLLGTLEYFCCANKIEYKIISPSEWRSTCGISGVKRELVKQEAIKFVKLKWNIEVKEDIAEAIAMGYSIAVPSEQKGWGTWVTK